MKATVRIKTLVVVGLLVLDVAVLVTLQPYHIPGVLGCAVALGFLLGRWSTT